MYFTKECQVACKMEATEGTKETLVAADVFLAYNVKFTPRVEMHRQDPARIDSSPRKSLPGLRSGNLSFDVPLVGAATAGWPMGSAGTLGASKGLSAAFIACGVKQVITVGPPAKSTYTPTRTVSRTSSLSNASATLGMYMGGKAYKIWGARGAWKLVLEDGKPGMISLEFTGADWEEVTEAMFTSGVELVAVDPPIFQGVTLTIDSYAAILSKLEIDGGNKVELRKDAHATSGYISAVITEREPKLKFDPENVANATYDFMSEWRTGSLVALAASLGSAAGNTIALSAPAVQYQGVSLTDRNGVSCYEVDSLLCGGSAGDDDWKIEIA